MTIAKLDQGDKHILGDTIESLTHDVDVREILCDILKELQKLNFHMSLITDTHVRGADINNE